MKDTNPNLSIDYNIINSLEIPLQMNQSLAKIPIMTERSVWCTIYEYLGNRINDFRCSIYETLYPAYVDYHANAVLVNGSLQYASHSFYSEPTNRFRSLVEMTLQYPPPFISMENLSVALTRGANFFNTSTGRLMTMVINGQHQEPGGNQHQPTNFNLTDLLPGIENHTFEIAPIHHSGVAFESIDLNFVTAMARSKIKFKHSLKSSTTTDNATKIDALQLNLPTAFPNLEDFHLPATTFASIIKTYFTALKERFTKKALKACLKNLVKKLIAEKFAPIRTGRHKEKVRSAVEEKKNLELNNLAQLESGNGFRNVKQLKRQLLNLKKKKTMIELQGKFFNPKMLHEIAKIENLIEAMNIGEESLEHSETSSHSFGFRKATHSQDDDSDSESYDEEDESILPEVTHPNPIGNNQEPSARDLEFLQSLCVGWIESVMIPEGALLTDDIVHEALPNHEVDDIKYIIQLVNSLRLYYPRMETLKTNKEINKTQLIPFLSLGNWIFAKLDYTNEIKKFIPTISAGKLWALALSPVVIYELFLHRKSGIFSIDGITNAKHATSEIMFHMLFRSSVINKAIHQLNMLNAGQKENAIFADRYFFFY